MDALALTSDDLATYPPRSARDRLRFAAEARGSVEAEGHSVSRVAQELARQWAFGLLTIEEIKARVLLIHGVS